MFFLKTGIKKILSQLILNFFLKWGGIFAMKQSGSFYLLFTSGCSLRWRMQRFSVYILVCNLRRPAVRPCWLRACVRSWPACWRISIKVGAQQSTSAYKQELVHVLTILFIGNVYWVVFDLEVSRMQGKDMLRIYITFWISILQ